jgi:hypothetical protein
MNTPIAISGRMGTGWLAMRRWNMLKAKDEGGRMKDEKGKFSRVSLLFHPSSFRLHPYSLNVVIHVHRVRAHCVAAIGTAFGLRPLVDAVRHKHND